MAYEWRGPDCRVIKQKIKCDQDGKIREAESADGEYKYFSLEGMEYGSLASDAAAAIKLFYDFLPLGGGSDPREDTSTSRFDIDGASLTSTITEGVYEQ